MINTNVWDAEKVILITNNRKAAVKYEGRLDVRVEKSYEQVLLKARDLIYDRHTLLTHPQASSLKPNQTPVRSVLLYPYREGDNYAAGCVLIEHTIDVFYEWQAISPAPDHYAENILSDFETIDLSVIDNVIGRMGLFL
ncbi:MAG: GrdX family protein [Lachnospiraceae bacterium]|nr:GrdX family protein [Lachnospiraceae bacterium]